MSTTRWRSVPHTNVDVDGRKEWRHLVVANEKNEKIVKLDLA